MDLLEFRYIQSEFFVGAILSTRSFVCVFILHVFMYEAMSVKYTKQEFRRHSLKYLASPVII